MRADLPTRGKYGASGNAANLFRDVRDLWRRSAVCRATLERLAAFGAGTALGMILGLFGVISMGRSFLRPGEALTAIAWRPLALVLGSVVLMLLPLILGLLVRSNAPETAQNWMPTMNKIGTPVPSTVA